MSSAERPKPNGRGKSDRDYARFLYQSRGSLLEAVSALQIAVRLKFFNNTTIEPLYTKAHRLSAKLNALINSLNREDSGLRR